uniref:Myelin basic protein n=2 Tax=Canis lupus familiaris TaxID=9615 RepID=A0A8P0TCR0_CANLF
MASQKRPSQRHGSKYLASASAMDHARHGFLPRHRDTGILDSLGRFFGGDRGVPKRGSGKDGHHAARTAHYGSLPQKSQHGRPQDENPVVHFFKNIVTPRTPPPSQGKLPCSAPLGHLMVPFHPRQACLPTPSEAAFPSWEDPGATAPDPAAGHRRLPPCPGRGLSMLKNIPDFLPMQELEGSPHGTVSGRPCGQWTHQITSPAPG